ncbi:Abscission/NoCut checkpoint regulator [Orchesella cincta]|uniref:Abscission/NoCut checkpoint regulator n=1 Tax=Orchesella cincta TaxID=48709 RepID=A0A1D2MJV6_ORCCI|nr:Abscission/NoCut checkpoint regulator [Orchesella cincta]
MSCHGCAEKFGFLKKEFGCPKCGFAFCKKCLRFTLQDPATKKQLHVCFKCNYDATQSPKKEPMGVINAIHRLESMDDPAKPPITVYRQPSRQVRLQELKRGLSVEDQQIVERLESLKKDDDSLVRSSAGQRKRTSEKIEEEIAERLARLKGEEYIPEAENKAGIMRNVKPQTEDDIIAKFSAEVEMDSKYEAGVVRDIEERLARLKGEPTAGQSSSQAQSQNLKFSIEDQEEIPEEDQVKLIMQKIQDELALEKRTGVGLPHDMEVDHGDVENQAVSPLVDSDDEEDDIDVDELCGICSEKRATLKCDECDGDIFCKACFQELHRDLGEVHKASVFKKK